MSLYTDTPEHEHAALSEKDAYLSLPPAYRCVRLAAACNKAFDYCATVALERSVEEGDSVWVACLWSLTPLARPCADALMAVDLCPPKGAVVESARLEVHNSYGGPVVCLSEAAGAMVSVPYEGVPLVALPFACVLVRVVCRGGVPPGELTARYRVLPTDARRHTAMVSHTRTVHAAPLNGGRVRVFSGMMDVVEDGKPCLPGCAVM